MNIITDELISASRFSGDCGLLETLRADERIAKRLSELDAVRYHRSMRARLLANAVRVDLRFVPRVASSFQQLASRLHLDMPMEAYVFQDSSINAFVTRGRSRILVALSSGAVNGLSDRELEFVIGHELGHAVFEHVDVAASYVLETGSLSPRSRMQLLAWQRASEISADRVGLICCGSLDIAATAVFKTISGLTDSSLSISALEFAEQWEQLEREVIEGGDDHHWQLTHPFPPLRMKAMILFAESGFLDNATSDDSEQVRAERSKADAAVHRLLAMMDPLARKEEGAADPILADFFLWGGIYLALANGQFEQSESDKLAGLTSQQRLNEATGDKIPSRDVCLSNFRGCIDGRRRKLRAGEIHRIMQGLLQVAVADGHIDDQEIEALQTLGKTMGVGKTACEILVTQFLQER